ncbi:C6 transcription factor [Cadophora sp. MPI-SDFR-AT-0126]|nr:C6 transcription factor [Leptodontidium sp. MPI-SDFR-AT-0119]KAH7378970.1 C6 transcription factor [Leotiomycetes sp. MPI-SDFR-AT-0126]
MQTPASLLSPPGIANAESSQLRSNKHKRLRAARACDRCRAKKYRCDECTPCYHCRKHALDCTYSGGQIVRIDGQPGDANYLRSLQRLVGQLNSRIHPSSSDVATIMVSNGHVGLDNPTPATSPEMVHRSRSPSAHPEAPSIPPSATSGPDVTLEGEGSEINNYTKGIEFHGSTSSMACLRCLHKHSQRQPLGPLQGTTASDPKGGASFISALHNPDFTSQGPVTPEDSAPRDKRVLSSQAHIFIQGYFDSLHVITPVIDKEEFYTRAQSLWRNNSLDADSSFMALYFSVQSLGALVRVWDEDLLDGMGRFEWSRKLFGEAQQYLNMHPFSNDLDTVRCLLLMAKICQNELSPHMAYMYMGQAIRTCLSAGYNRETPGQSEKQARFISRTWWGLFAMDIEMGLSLGRPDTLGLDAYHNRRFPPKDSTEVAIIPCMVEFGRIMRKVAVDVYYSPQPLQCKFEAAIRIEQEMNQWVCALPNNIRPDLSRPEVFLGGLKEPNWSRRQRLVLTIRYHNVRMLLFRPFLVYSGTTGAKTTIEARDGILKCIDSAQATIRTIHNVFIVQTFFRSWWWNTTYIMFAATLLLLHANTPAASLQRDALLSSVDMAVEILEAMDESVVAKRSADIIASHVSLVREAVVDTPVLAPAINLAISALPAQGFSYDLAAFDGMTNIFDDLEGWSNEFYTSQGN